MSCPKRTSGVSSLKGSSSRKISRRWFEIMATNLGQRATDVLHVRESSKALGQIAILYALLLEQTLRTSQNTNPIHEPYTIPLNPPVNWLGESQKSPPGAK